MKNLTPLTDGQRADLKKSLLARLETRATKTDNLAALNLSPAEVSSAAETFAPDAPAEELWALYKEVLPIAIDAARKTRTRTEELERLELDEASADDPRLAKTPADPAPKPLPKANPQLLAALGECLRGEKKHHDLQNFSTWRNVRIETALAALRLVKDDPSLRTVSTIMLPEHAPMVWADENKPRAFNLEELMTPPDGKATCNGLISITETHDGGPERRFSLEMAFYDECSIQEDDSEIEWRFVGQVRVVQEGL